MSIFYFLVILQGIITFLIFWRMSVTNKEEWLFTKFYNAMLIGAIVGFILGAIWGYIFYNLSGLFIASSCGMLSGSLTFLAVKYLSDYTYKE